MLHMKCDDSRFCAKYHIFRIRRRFTIAAWAWTYNLFKKPSLGRLVLNLAFGIVVAVCYVFRTDTKSEGPADIVSRTREAVFFLYYLSSAFGLVKTFTAQRRFFTTKYLPDERGFLLGQLLQPFGFCWSSFGMKSEKLLHMLKTEQNG